jgi:uncharacterized protein (TIGR02246 family)
MDDLREKINELLFNYIDALNTLDADRFANNFCEDGVWEVSGLFTKVGRDQIRETMGPAARAYKWIFQLVHQFHILERTETTAKVRAYVTEVGNKAGSGHFFLAAYSDRCRLENGVWRFEHRLCDILYRGPSDLTAAPWAYPAPKR